MSGKLSDSALGGFGQYVKSTPTASLGILLWLFFTIIAMSILLYLKQSENERLFSDQAVRTYNEVHEKISINETVLQGFVSMLRLGGDSPAIRQYTTEMRLAYPHIYSVGFQQYVLASDREKFEQQQRDKGYKDFKIMDFSYEEGRQFHSVSTVASHYATLFADSANPDAQKVMGLDQLAVPFLKQALIASIHSGQAVATRPFTLAEGGRGYVLYKALETIPEFDTDSGFNYDSTAVSILIKTDVLLSLGSKSMPHAAVKISYRDIENGEITESLAPEHSSAYVANLGKLVFQQRLDEFGQPFLLTLESDSGLTWWDVALAATLFSLFMLVGFLLLQWAYRRNLKKLANERVLRDLVHERQALTMRVAERTEELEQKTEDIRELAGKLVNLQEDDYRYIARELHDEFGQLITTIGINTKLVSDRVRDIPGAIDLTNETLALVDCLHISIHSLIGRLRPEALDTFGLKVSIENCLALFKLEQSGTKCLQDLDPAIDNLPDNCAIAVYRAIQELVNNAVKHGRPKHIELEVRLLESQVLLKVTDDGQGMDMTHRRKGYGLTGLSERLLALNGVMDISSSPRAGCTVTITLPL